MLSEHFVGRLHIAKHGPAEDLPVEDELEISSFVVIFGVFGAIFLLLRWRGLHVVASAYFFVVSLVTTQLAMSKLAAPPFNYRFPASITALHFYCVLLVCAFYSLAINKSMNLLSPTSMSSLQRF